jgi:hypothetical protein
MIIPTSDAATQVRPLGRMKEDTMAPISLDLQTTTIPLGSIAPSSAALSK